MKMVPEINSKLVRFEIIEVVNEKEIGFDPSVGSKGGNATCPFCGTVADSNYIKAEGCAKRIGEQMMAVACISLRKKGKVYLDFDQSGVMSIIEKVNSRISKLCAESGITVPEETIITDAKNSCWTHLYGLTSFGELFTDRQLLCLLTVANAIRKSELQIGYNSSEEKCKAIVTCLGIILDRLADFNSTGCTWNYTGGRGVLHTMARQAIPMTWDFAETNPFNPNGASWVSGIQDVPLSFDEALKTGKVPGRVIRANATHVPLDCGVLDAVITDPPYYDNVPYADISDFFYVWLKRTVSHLYPEHFASIGTPKKPEAVADATRHNGDKNRATKMYEDIMARSFREAHRVLKPGGQMLVVYAHKTTLGWATLVDALRSSGFIVTEAWPLDTERSGRLRAMNSAALASSIFLIAKKRSEFDVGNYESEVIKELETVILERIDTLWHQGISGADLVIACVGAGLRTFTRFSRVEYANGEEVPAERFLAEVETVVLETILNRLSKEIGGKGNRQHSLMGIDPTTRFYILWRYTYRWSELDAGEAIVFANGTHVELEGQGSLSSGACALVEKKKSKYRLRDFEDRGEDKKLGLPIDGTTAPLIDILHRSLWLMEYRPHKLTEFLRDSRVNREQMRLVAQALAGPALKGSEIGDISPTGELAALAKITANWKSVIEDAALTPQERKDQRSGQKTLFEKEESQ